MKSKGKNNMGDLGLEDSLSFSNRMINHDGSFNVIREGGKHRVLYQTLIEMGWGPFLLVVLFSFIFINALFALLFIAVGLDGISGLNPSVSFWRNWAQATFFSIQTFTTVGYGTFSPIGFWSEVIASLDALVGLMSFALVTGLIFARFAKPRAHILFSDQAIIAPYKEGNSFQFRIVNKRNSKILDVETVVVMTWVDHQSGGKRHYFTLPLERKKITLFPVNWTIVHPIDKKSPLYNKKESDLASMKAEFIIMVKGYDETYAQTVHITNSYISNEIIWGVKYKKMYINADMGTVLKMNWLSAIEEIPAAQRTAEETLGEHSSEGERSTEN